MRIWFDMDGTLNRLYEVPNWLEKLRAYDPSPYAEAKVMHNMSLLARLLNQVLSNGHECGIKSWLSMNTTKIYDAQVTATKYSWLDEHLGSVEFTDIQIVAYGTPKEEGIGNGEILFDDNEGIRKAWNNAGGIAYPPEMIIPVLKAIVKGEELPGV